jgi:hypothetical protein
MPESRGAASASAAPAAVTSPKVEGQLATGRPLRPVDLAAITIV